MIIIIIIIIIIIALIINIALIQVCEADTLLSLALRRNTHLKMNYSLNKLVKGVSF